VSTNMKNWMYAALCVAFLVGGITGTLSFTRFILCGILMSVWGWQLEQGDKEEKKKP
jgi:hypothetical protein